MSLCICVLLSRVTEKTVFKAKALVYQYESKQKIRKDPFVQELERVMQQQNRKLKRKLEAAFELSHCNKQCKIEVN